MILFKMEETKPTEKVNSEAMNTQTSELSEVEKVRQELAEMEDLLQRTQANFENYRKQMEKRMEETNALAARDVITGILPILDNFELALKHVPQNVHPDFVHGMELIYSQLFTILENQGVTIMETRGKKFDPYFHEALLKVESELPENTVLEEFQKGYLLNGQVIRHAKVKISTGMKEGIKEDAGQEND